MAGEQKKFNDSKEAVAFIAAAMSRDFPDATAEVVQVVRNRPRRATCEVKQIAPLLEKACSQFPMASVEYHPGNAYGFVAEIRCHGEQAPARQTSFQRHESDRPRVLVMLKRVKEDEILIGSHQVPGGGTPST